MSGTNSILDFRPDTATIGLYGGSITDEIYHEDLNRLDLDRDGIEDMRLGCCRRIGRAGFYLIMSLDENAISLGKRSTVSHDESAWTLSQLSKLDAMLARGQQYFGKTLSEDDIPSDAFYAAFDDLYKYSPLSKYQLQRLSDNDRQALESEAFDDRQRHDTTLDPEYRPIANRDPQLRRYVERTHEWLTVDAQPDPSHRGDQWWLNLPEGPRQVRGTANVLFHYLANDGWLFAGLNYKPPEDTL